MACLELVARRPDDRAIADLAVEHLRQSLLNI